MADLVKVAHTKKVSIKLISAFGLIEVDENGCAEVPAEMAAKIGAGDYGETWRLLKGPKVKAEPEPEPEVEVEVEVEAQEEAEPIKKAKKKVFKKKKRVSRE